MYTVALTNHTIDKIEELVGKIDKKLKKTISEELRSVVSSGDQQMQVHSVAEGTEDIVGELDDFLEIHFTEVPRRQTRLQAISLMLPNLYLRACLKPRIRSTISMLERAKKPASESAESRCETSSLYAIEGKIEGRDTEKDEIITRLREDGDEVISIVGIGGIGKTALASLVYYDREIKKHFRKQSWATVSRTSSFESIAKDILMPFQQEISGDTEQIMQLIREKVGGERWLLVLDGLESQELLKTVLKNLDESSVHYRLLMTTRSKIDPFPVRNTLVPLTGLHESVAWPLLQSIVFKKGQQPSDQNIIAVGKEIVKEICEGVPLTIKVIGKSLQRNKDSLQEWLSIKEHGLLKPGQSSSNSPEVNMIFKSLESSLDCLPANLQLCFAYCGLLPKRHDIDLHTLIVLWMAQGFINSDPKAPAQPIEDIGYGYFLQLLELYLFHDVERDEGYNAKSCRMQSLVHDLAIYLSCNKIILMDPHGETVHEGVHHITLDFNLDSSWQIPKSLLKAQGLRTILLRPQLRLPHEVKLSTSTCHAIFRNFKRLRVLDLHDLGMKTMPDSLGGLKHLRYLDLSKNSFATLPRCTTSLRYLQTLKLSNCHTLKVLPDGFNNLVNLRHLEIDGCYLLTHMPLGLGSLTSFQTLSRFVVSNINNSASSSVGLEQLKKLNELRGNLEILHLERAKCKQSEDDNQFLDQKQQLQCLTLRWNRDFDDDDEEKDNPYKGDDRRLLELLKPHKNLKTLSIMGFKGNFPSWYFNTDLMLVRLSLYFCPNIKFIPSLHQLRNLKIVQLQRLEEMEFVANDLPNSASTSSFFPSLKEVTVCDCPHLKSWWESGDASPNGTAATQYWGIEKLEIRYCPELTTLPFYPEELILLCRSMDQPEQIMKKMAETPLHASSSFSSSPGHRSLKSLTLGKIVDSESLPEEGLKSLTTLQRLHIQDCYKLTSIQRGIQHLSSLEDLKIENCMKINLHEEWSGLKKLRNLTIKGIPKLEALPQGLANAESLKDLKLYSCPGLTSLPKWIGKLESLTIEDCPKLLPRFQKETGEDWRQIADIQNKSIK